MAALEAENRGLEELVRRTEAFEEAQRKELRESNMALRTRLDAAAAERAVLVEQKEAAADGWRRAGEQLAVVSAEKRSNDAVAVKVEAQLRACEERCSRLEIALRKAEQAWRLESRFNEEMGLMHGSHPQPQQHQPPPPPHMYAHGSATPSTVSYARPTIGSPLPLPRSPAPPPPTPTAAAAAAAAAISRTSAAAGAEFCSPTAVGSSAAAEWPRTVEALLEKERAEIETSLSDERERQQRLVEQTFLQQQQLAQQQQLVLAEQRIHLSEQRRHTEEAAWQHQQEERQAETERLNAQHERAQRERAEQEAAEYEAFAAAAAAEAAKQQAERERALFEEGVALAAAEAASATPASGEGWEAGVDGVAPLFDLQRDLRAASTSALGS